mmetsp:Transcript_18770/g.45329  ORF Transcript_18770/g.45329 Transcript_18770/m.45329 type:complete len:420 (-) Transcript_18770:85-1344(-)
MHRRQSFNSGAGGGGGGPATSSVPPPSGMYQRTRSVGASSPSMYSGGDNYHNNPSTSSSSSWMGAGNSNNNNNSSNSLSYSVVGDDELKYNHPSSGKNRFLSMRDVLYYRVLPCLILMILPWIPAQMTRSTVNSKQREIQSMMDEQKDLVSQLDEVTENIRTLEENVVSLTRDNELSFQELERSGKLLKTQEIQNKDGYEEQEEEEEALVQRIDDLEKVVKLSASRRLEQRYGSGVYRMRVNVRDETGKASSFVIQTADVMELPHAIDHFVRMVESKLWDGLTFVHEYDSKVVMATPMTQDASHTWAGQRFTDANITHMAFTETSVSFPPPHYRKFSVGFSGRPGGPSFYINMDEEVVSSHEHESMFGIVMEGRDVVLQFFLKNHVDGQDKKMLSIDSIEMMTPRVAAGVGRFQQNQNL